MYVDTMTSECDLQGVLYVDTKMGKCNLQGFVYIDTLTGVMTWYYDWYMGLTGCFVSK